MEARVARVKGNITGGARAGYSAYIPDSLMAIAEQHHHLLKYLVIGGLASAIDLLLFLALYNLADTSELIAHSISVPAAVIFSFTVNARHNFKTVDHPTLRFMSFVVVCAIGFAAGYGVVLAAQHIEIGANAGKIASLPIVFAVQYLLNKNVTFRPATVPNA